MANITLTVPQSNISLVVPASSFAISGFQGPPGSGGGGGTVLTQDSVQGDGTSANKIQLVGDVVTPSNGQFYGYQSGARGFFLIPYSALSGVPTSFSPSAHQASHRRGGSDPLVSAAGDAAATDLVLGSDSRLTNSRAPTGHHATHEHGGSDPVSITYSDILGLPTLGTSASKDVPASGDASTSQVVFGTDSRLTNSRTPIAHETTHLDNGTDPIPLATTARTGLAPQIPATNPTKQFHRGDNTYAPANYPDLTNIPASFTPSAHASTHESGGSDTIPLDTLGAPTDVTTLNATTSAHGLLPKLGGGTANFLRADGTWSAPSGSGIPSADVQAFTTPGAFTWTKPAGTPKVVEIICIGGGGGGGAGGYAAAATAVGGGGGGSGGGYSRVTVPASGLGATVSGNTGAGGTGGASQTTVGQAGSGGQAYAAATHDSWFGSATSNGANIIYAAGGKPGGGGPVSTSSGAAGAVNAIAEFAGTAGGAGGANGGNGSNGASQLAANNAAGGGGGGGGGGSFSTTNAESFGAVGSNLPARQGNIGQGALGGSHTSGGNGSSAALSAYLPGAGGGGGGSSNTAATAGGTGGSGGNYGGAGGGGGAGDANLNAVGSGAGGNGANGVVVVITYF